MSLRVSEGLQCTSNSASLNAARLATLPESVLDVAAIKSKELESEAHAKKLGNLFVGPLILRLSTDILQHAHTSTGL